MIFYTLKGPGYKLEIHEDKMHLFKREWLALMSKKCAPELWRLEELSHFEISVPKFIFTGKVNWKTFDGKTGSFRFSTHPVMMKKIELYLQKRIIKNHHRVRGLPAPKARKEKRPTLRMAA